MTQVIVQNMNLQNNYMLGDDDEFHRCPNADFSACEFCKLLHTFTILVRCFKSREELELVKIIEECFKSVNELRRLVDRLTPHLSRYDFDESVPGNGYRTNVYVVRSAVTKCLYLASEINDKNRIFSPTTHVEMFQKLVDWMRIFRIMLVVLTCLNDFVSASKSDSLFTSSKEALDKLISMSKERENVVGFHGRLLGFQYCKSIRGPLRFISTLMASYSEIYKSASTIKSYITSSNAFIHYWRNPCERADRISRICTEDPLNFFKEFWLIQERGFVKIFSNCLGESVESNLEISVPPTKLRVETVHKKKLTILPPNQYIGIKPIMLRLISHKMRAGSVCSGNNSTAELSRTLVIHCHGGGFVAQSSNSHLIYLKAWAKGVGAPIVSVDYSLAPEAPYPRALHETFYAYLWALENAHLLGSTAERVIFAGDSAGGLMLTGVTILCAELGLRIPDGLFIVYAPVLIESAVSPARVLSLADPLIPYPALAACLGAYLGKTFDPSLADLPGSLVEGDWEPEENYKETCSRKFTTLILDELTGVNIPRNEYHLSPLIAPDSLIRKFPPTSIVTTVFDPCLDDCVEFGKRLRDNGIPVTLDILNSLPHGFLNFGKISEECYNGIEICYRRLKEFII